MFSDLDAAPPQSQLRRPWSPVSNRSINDEDDISYDVYDTAPSADNEYLYHHHHDAHSFPAFPAAHFPQSQSQSPLPQSPPSLDVAHFPVWSRSWYTQDRHRPPATSPSLTSPLYAHTHTDESPLPWSNDPEEYLASPVHPKLKQERMRMLEREFATRPEDDSEDEKPRVGGVNSRGELITHGPKKRIALRVLQIILALAAAVPCIYVAIIVKPKPPPLPANKPPAYALYVVAPSTLLLLLYLALIRPCLFRRQHGDNHELSAHGMMVLPIPSAPSKKKNKKNKPGFSQSDVHVNLIVDPTMFQSPSSMGTHDYEENSSEVPSSYTYGKSSSPSKRQPLLAALANEAAWKNARHQLVVRVSIDGVLTVIWSALFVFLLAGAKCPVKGGGTWCTGYNVSEAAACLLALSFGVGVFFGVKDIYASRVSPRTRGR